MSCKRLTRTEAPKQCPQCREKRKKKEKKFCEYCGKELVEGQTRFCSRSCSAKITNMERIPSEVRENKKNNIKKKSKKVINNNDVRFCKTCGKDLPLGHKSFCSNVCSTTFIGQLSALKASNTVLPKEEDLLTYNDIKDLIPYAKECPNCGKIFRGRNAGRERKYCSVECCNEWLHKERLRKLNECKDHYTKGNGKPSNTIRRELFKKYNDSCQLCGWNTKNPFTNKVPLQIHHIDGNPMNNELTNLQLLCPNCHALTETYGNKNAGKGREARRVRRWKNDTNN